MWFRSCSAVVVTDISLGQFHKHQALNMQLAWSPLAVADQGPQHQGVQPEPHMAAAAAMAPRLPLPWQVPATFEKRTSFSNRGMRDLKSLLFELQCFNRPRKKQGLSLRGSPKPLGKGRKNAQKKQGKSENKNNKEIKKKKGWRVRDGGHSKNTMA